MICWGLLLVEEEDEGELDSREDLRTSLRSPGGT